MSGPEPPAAADRGSVGRPSLLYISPVVPALTGNGLVMRAGIVLEALARHYDVSLMVVPVFFSPTDEVPDALSGLCREVALARPAWFFEPPPSRWRRVAARLGRGREKDDVFSQKRFDVVHLFRLFSLKFSAPYLAAGHPVRQLDLDDVESATHRRLASLRRRKGDVAKAEAEEEDARRAEAEETDVMARFDRVFVCSEDDAAALRGRGRAEVHVLPNAVRAPPDVSDRESGEPFTFLFVGTLGYYPNVDALAYFCDEVLPVLRRVAPVPFAVSIVGQGRAPTLERLRVIPEVQLVGPVADPSAWYQVADAVIVPIRAGGGTRIKVLEAFSQRRPVVSTTMGIEGIRARHEEHVLLADSPGAFADACVRLMSEPALARRLVENAGELVRRCYSLEAITEILDALALPRPRRGSRSASARPAPR